MSSGVQADGGCSAAAQLRRAIARPGRPVAECDHALDQRGERIVAEIVDASTQQASGIDQINSALNRMDQVNAALVEENPGTAGILEDQQSAMSGVLLTITSGPRWSGARSDRHPVSLMNRRA